MHYYNYEKKYRGLGIDGLTPPMQKLNKARSVTLSLKCYNKENVSPQSDNVMGRAKLKCHN